VPFDGGHILEEALGPKRARLSAIISLIFGGLTALWFLVAWGSLWGTFLVGMAAMQSYQRLKNQPRGTAHPTAAERPAPAAPAAEPIPQELNRQLIAAEHALNAESFEQAGTIAELVLASSPPKAARVRALHILGWAYLLNGQPREAARVTTSIEKAGEVDLALVGAILRAKGELATAREVFEAARATGDDRKEIIGPLIQILIGEGEIARAAAIAFDIVESLSEDDAAEMARIAFEAGKHEWASRLFESMFERTDEASYAYDAARSRALEGDPPGALNLLRRAVAAGYSDAARAWSDSALERLRRELGDELESVLPRPS